MEERKLPDGFCKGFFPKGEAQRRKGEERVVRLRGRAFPSSNEARRKIPKQKVLQRIFSEGRDVTKKSEERVASYADERFEERRSDSGKIRSKMLFENYTEEEMT